MNEQRSDRGSLLLVSMPFGPLLQPSLALSLLRQVSPIPAESLYFTLAFAERIGAELYEWIAEGNPSTTAVAGEWLFSTALFGRPVTDPAAYMDAILRGPQLEGEPVPEPRIQELLAVRDEVESFLDACTAQVLARQPRIVGLTSVFQQNTASLALAKRIKARAPGIVVLLGGSNCESVMGAELAQRFPFVDGVVSGEGELVLPQIVERVLAGQSLAGLPGVFTPDTAPHTTSASAPSVQDMDTLPIPDFTDYFQQWDRSGLAGSTPPRLLLETSRGCWWGEKQHCTFCGLNGANMAFRRKSGARALRELDAIAAQRPGANMLVVDNILDMRYFDDFIPGLAGRGMDLFYEVKANLKKHHVQLLRDAGVSTIQPGIESLSDAVLKLMRKGVSALQNIQLLKWCQELGVWPLWNFLWGFPGEPPEEYARMAELAPHLTHLPPPKFGVPLRLDRFSPNFEHAAEMGFADVAPVPAYAHVYPFPTEALMRLAYFFEYKYADHRDVEGYTQRLKEQIREWQQSHEASALFYFDKGDDLLVCDFRPSAKRELSVVSGLQRVLLLACDEVCSLPRLRQLAAQFDRAEGTRTNPGESSADRIEEVIRPLVDCGYVVQSGNACLSLVFPASKVADRLHATDNGQDGVSHRAEPGVSRAHDLIALWEGAFTPEALPDRGGVDAVAGVTGAAGTSDAASPGAPAAAFAALFDPVIANRSQDVADRIPQGWANLSDAAKTALQRSLLQLLSGLCAQPLDEIFQSRCSSESNDAALRRSLYDDLVREMRARDLRAWLPKHADLVTLLETVTGDWVDSTHELLQRLQDDATRLERTFESGTGTGRVVSIETDLGDRHEGGRVVCGLSFENGRRLIYKPRDVGMEHAYNGLLQWLNEHGLSPPLRSLVVVEGPGYGWVEAVSPQACERSADVTAYYQRAGMLLALFAFLDATDCHMSNVAACGADPVLWDAETFFASGAAGGPSGDTHGPSAALCDAASPRLGFLPHREPEHGHAHDLSGLGGQGAQPTHFRVPVWENDAGVPRLTYRTALLRPQGNRVFWQGSHQSPAQHCDAIVHGFSTMFRFLSQHRVGLIAATGPLARMAAQPRRLVVRRSRDYFRVMNGHLWTRIRCLPEAEELLREELRQIPLAIAPEQVPGDLVQRELRALTRLDIPRFVARPTAAQARGVCAQLAARLDSMGEVELERQLGTIRVALAASELPGSTGKDRSA